MNVRTIEFCSGIEARQRMKENVSNQIQFLLANNSQFKPQQFKSNCVPKDRREKVCARYLCSKS